MYIYMYILVCFINKYWIFKKVKVKKNIRIVVLLNKVEKGILNF